MRAGKATGAIAIVAILAVGACGNDAEPRLMNLTSHEGPDEFSILPPKPLEMPASLNELPQPTPGGANLTDPTPKADAIVALGGNPSTQQEVPATDAALYARATRFGVDGGIRDTLAAEDLAWRRANNGRLLERMFHTNVYYKAYRKMALDQYGELAYWRRRGLATPSAPPEAAR